MIRHKFAYGKRLKIRFISILIPSLYCISFSDCTANVTLIGNGVCNDETNNPGCFYDGGDCCVYNVNTDHCSDCTCYHKKTCIAGTHPLVADGFCNDETNNADCNYDGGDCACSGDTVNDGSDNCFNPDPSSCEFLVSTNVKLSVQYVFLWFCFNFPTA